MLHYGTFLVTLVLKPTAGNWVVAILRYKTKKKGIKKMI